MSNFDPRSVEEGMRDYLLHKTGKSPTKVTVHTQGFGYVVEIKTEEPLAEDIREQIALMLPHDYQLEIG